MAQAAPWIGLGLSALGASGALGGNDNQSVPPGIPPQLLPTFNASQGLILKGLAGRNQGFQGQFAAPFGALGQQAISGISSALNPQGDLATRSRILTGIGETGGLDQASLNVTRGQLQPGQDVARSQFQRSSRGADAARGGFFSSGALGKELLGLAALDASFEDRILSTTLSKVPSQLQAARSLGELPSVFGVALGAEAAERSVRQLDVSGAREEFHRNSPRSFLGDAISLLSGTPTTQPTFGPGKGETLLSAVGAAAPLIGSVGSSGSKTGSGGSGK